MDFTLNGESVSVEVRAGASALEVLRESCGVTSVKDGCAPEGSCGACTVLIDGKAVVSCAQQATRLAGREVTTQEGLASSDSAFIRMPGEQKPHWEAPAATKLSAHRPRSASSIPSWVVTSRPSSRDAFCAQETTALPSIITVHAPQDPSGAQPSLTDVTPQDSRSTSSTLSPPVSSTETRSPLRVKSIKQSFAVRSRRPRRLECGHRWLCRYSGQSAPPASLRLRLRLQPVHQRGAVRG